jgi:hypothetical protein
MSIVRYSLGDVGHAELVRLLSSAVVEHANRFGAKETVRYLRAAARFVDRAEVPEEEGPDPLE